jgi:putative transposase
VADGECGNVQGMARKLRVEFEGAIYHLTVRANGRSKLFEDDTDRRYLLDRIAEAAETYRVRIYLFCLMANHFHLIVETPRGNLGRFMQGVLTGYGVYYNRRHRSHGHVTQGRYGARLVEGNEYLLKLSRYVHLNPVKIASMKSKSLSERLEVLRKHSWSSFQAYAGLAPRNNFVACEPVLALLGGGKGDREDRYREFVETGVAKDDEEFAQAMWLSTHCIGSEDFREGVEERYKMLLQERREPEDVAFRRIVKTLSAERIIDVVASVAGLDPKDLVIRQNDCRWRAVTARMLCQYGGLTQRAAARILGVRTGVAVCCQLRKLTALLQLDKDLANKVCRIEGRLVKELKQ